METFSWKKNYKKTEKCLYSTFGSKVQKKNHQKETSKEHLSKKGF